MDIKLVPLTVADREQFILDNQQAFKYGAQEEFGMRDDRMEEGMSEEESVAGIDPVN